MKNLIILLVIAVFISGCAATKPKKEKLAPGQLSIEEITGTDTLTPPHMQKQASKSTPAGNYDQSVIERIERLEEGQKELRRGVNSLDQRVTRLEESLNGFEKKILEKIRGSEPLAQRQAGPKAYPSVAFTEDKAVRGFELGSTKLSDEMKQKINALHVYLVDKLSKTENNISVTIEGWADNSGSRAYNLKLSKKRAEVARNYLEGLLTAEQKSRLNIKAIGRGMHHERGQRFRFVVFWIK